MSSSARPAQFRLKLDVEYTAALMMMFIPPAYLKVHTASYHVLGNGKIRRFACSLLFSGVALGYMLSLSLSLSLLPWQPTWVAGGPEWTLRSSETGEGGRDFGQSDTNRV